MKQKPQLTKQTGEYDRHQKIKKRLTPKLKQIPTLNQSPSTNADEKQKTTINIQTNKYTPDK